MITLKKKHMTLALVLVMFVSLSVAASLGFFKTSYSIQGGSGSTTIYCNDFEYMTCAEDTLNPTSHEVVASRFFQCPTTATRCEVQGASSSYGQPYVGSGCYLNWLQLPECSNRISDCYGSCTLSPGQYIVNEGGISQPTLTVKVYEYKLFWCGKSPCSAYSAGVPVQGASGCSFVPSQVNKAVGDRVYDQNGNLVDPDYEGLYTVPPGRSYQYTTYSLRRECGNLEESCSSNSDCADRYPYSITYGGEEYGVTFQAGQMVFYGCKTTQNECLEKDVLASGTEKCLQYNKKSYCDAVQLYNVECIPDSDTCAGDSVCKQVSSTRFECVEPEDKPCTYDGNCGTKVSCDWVDKTLNKPVCSGGYCDTQETPVDCCYDTNCPDGYYCDSDYTCKQEVTPKSPCPYECCVDEASYVDKPCTGSESYCCPDNSCSQAEQYCDGYVPGSGSEDQGDCPPIWGIIPDFWCMFLKGVQGIVDFILGLLMLLIIGVVVLFAIVISVMFWRSRK